VRWGIRRFRFQVISYREVVANWYRAPFAVALPSLAEGLRFRDGERFSSTDANPWPKLESEVRWKLLQKHNGARMVVENGNRTVQLTFRGTTLGFVVDDTPLEIAYQLYEAFDQEDYRRVDAAGQAVVDVGANVGDTAIYFLLRGATKVVGVEPNFPAVSMFERNMRLNKVSDRASVIGALVSDRPGVASVAPEDSLASNRRPRETSGGRQVPVISLQNVLEMAAVDRPFLKLDCEGAEYDILRTPEDTLRRFGRVFGEYHYGFEGVQRPLAKAGFTVRETRTPEIFRNPFTHDTMTVGMFDAIRA
jgi:FkbM family methyltransferase